MIDNEIVGQTHQNRFTGFYAQKFSKSLMKIQVLFWKKWN